MVKVCPEPEGSVRSGEVREGTQQVAAFCQTVGDVVTPGAVDRDKPCSSSELLYSVSAEMSPTWVVRETPVHVMAAMSEAQNLPIFG